jgi:hypothetical protein
MHFLTGSCSAYPQALGMLTLNYVSDPSPASMWLDVLQLFVCNCPLVFEYARMFQTHRQYKPTTNF